MIHCKKILCLYIGLIAAGFSHAQTFSNSFTPGGTLKDATIKNGADATSNFGTDNTLAVFKDNTAGQTSRTVIGFDLTAIPSNAVITEATLTLTPESINTGASVDYVLEQATSTWEEGTVNWSTQPGTETANAVTVSNTALTPHDIDVTEHARYMASYPNRNWGWSIKLADESVTGTDYGLVFHALDDPDPAKRPQLEVSYVMPIEVTGEVTHCTAGNTDGELDLTITGGSGSYSYFSIYKVERDMAFAAAEKLVFIKAINSMGTIDNSTIDEIGLEPGVYRIQIRDALWSSNVKHDKLNYIKYKHFLVGRDGEVTDGFIARYGVVSQVHISKNMGTFHDEDSENLNFRNTGENTLRVGHSGTNSHGSSTSSAYKHAALLNLNIDFPEDLDFPTADLKMTGWTRYYQTHGASNAATFSLVNSDWDLGTVTWNTRPSVDPSFKATVAKSSVPNGYSPSSESKDDVDLKPFIEYWKNNPNYGIELALESYDYATVALRSYWIVTKNRSHFEFSFTPNDVVPVYDLDKGLGSITVDAPSGVSPYTYLISEEPIPSITEVWDSIKDKGIDSTTFFGGDVASATHTFDLLQANQYYIKVIDNTGTEVLDKKVNLTPHVALNENTNLLLDLPGTISVHNTALGDGWATINETVPVGTDGGITLKSTELGNGTGGFRSADATGTFAATDLDFGYVTTGSNLQVYANGSMVYETTIDEDDALTFAKQGNFYLFFLNDVVQAQSTIAFDKAIKFDLKLTSSKIKIVSLKGGTASKVASSSPVIVNNPAFCDLNGVVTIGTYNTIDFNLTNLETGINTAYLGSQTLNLPIGTYSLTTNYLTNSGFMASTAPTTFQVGYPLTWNPLTASANTTINQPTAGIVTFTTLAGDCDGEEKIALPFAGTVFESVSFQTNFLPVLGPCKSCPAPTVLPKKAEIELNVPGSALARVVISDFGVFAQSIEIYNGSSTLVYSGSASANDTYLISYKQATNQIEVFQNGTSRALFATSFTLPNNITVTGKVQNYAELINTFITFCDAYPIPDQQVQLERKLSGMFHLVPTDNILKVEYNEEYMDADGNLNYTIIAFDGTELNTGVTPVIFGDNRIDFDLNSASITSGNHYVLRIDNDKNESFFLRFKKQ